VEESIHVGFNDLRLIRVGQFSWFQLQKL